MSKTNEQRIRPCPHCGKAATKSGYFGVSKRTWGGSLYFVVFFKNQYRASYRSAIEAALHYDELARKLYGAHAILNFPNGRPAA